MFIQTQLKNFRLDGNQIISTNFEGKYLMYLKEISLCKNE